MKIADHPLYKICDISKDEFRKALSSINGDFDAVRAPLPADQALNSVEEVLEHVSTLDTDVWDQQFVIVIDREDWGAQGGVLLLNTDFEGYLDGKLLLYSRL